ncbi:MAG TPA: hypothetical protein VGB20_06265 [bacterium]
MRVSVILVGLVAWAAHSAITAAAEPVRIRAGDYAEGGMPAIAPCESMLLDLTGVSLEEGSGGADVPDTLAVQIQRDGRSDYYAMPFVPGRVLYDLNAETLTGRASPPFIGFRDGAFVHILIGYEPFTRALDEGMFRDFWSLTMRVER